MPGSADPVLYTTQHDYGDAQGQAFALSVTEQVTAGQCKAEPAAWKPLFAVAITIG